MKRHLSKSENNLSEKLIYFKYLDKLPLFDKCIYQLIGKKAKRRSIQEILDRYIFLPNKIYYIEIYNPNHKVYNYDEVKDLSQIDAWRICAECAEYRYISICNGQICIDHFFLDNREFIIDLGFLYQDIEYKFGDIVKSIITGEIFSITFTKIFKMDSPDDYNRNTIINSKLEDNYEFDMHYEYKTLDDFPIVPERYPISTFIIENKRED